MLRRTLVLSAVALALVVTAGLATRSRAPQAAPTPTPDLADRMTPERAIQTLRLPAYVAPAEIRDTGAHLEYALPSRAAEIKFDEATPVVSIGAMKITPVGSYGSARPDAGRVIYEGHDAALIYAPSPTGLKEDIVLYSRPATSDFAWALDLPPTMEARLLDDGSVGIFELTNDPYSGVQACDQRSADLIALGRRNAAKDRLAYRLPPPVVYDAASRGAPARFSLAPGFIAVHVDGLDQLSYPVTIDPDVLITTSGDFVAGGNNEQNVNFRPNGEIRRAPMVAALGTWTTESAVPFIGARQGHSTVAYNGYLYVVGGMNGGVAFNTVQFAAINNTTGALGAFATTSSFTDGRTEFGCVAYNGFMYIIGGKEPGGNVYSDVQVAPINADGTLGAWSSTTALPDKRWSFGVAVWGTFIYVIAGEGSSGLTTEVLYSNIRPAGNLGSWINTKSSYFSRNGAAVAVNGYLVMTGGNDGTFDLNTVQVSKISGIGDLDGWSNTSPLQFALAGHKLVSIGGQLVTVGLGSSQMAPIGSGGGVGNWRADTSYPPEFRSLPGAAVYNDQIYVTGGDQFGVALNTVVRVNAVREGPAGNGIGGGNSPIIRWNHGAVALNGFLYIIGGHTDAAGTVLTNNVSYVAIDPNSGLVSGSWTTSLSPLPAPRALFGIAVFGGRIFITGGTLLSIGTADASCLYATIDPVTGANSAWTVTTAMTFARKAHGCVTIGNRLYVIGGINSSGTEIIANHWIALGNGGGFQGAWDFGNAALSPGVSHMACEVSRNKIYVMGGQSGAATVGTVKMGNVDLNSGAIQSWTTLNSLPENRTDMFSFVANEVLYCGTGRLGVSDPSGQANMFFAPINENGTIGVWTQTQYPYNGISKRLIYRNGVYYVTCGIEGISPSSFTDTFRLDSLGQALAWTTETSIPVANYGMGGAASGPFIYVSAGSSGSNAVYMQAVNADNRLQGLWTAVTSLPQGNQYHRMGAHNNYIYSVGGSVSPNEVHYNTINPTTGALGASWTLTSALPNTGTYGHGMVIFGNNIYVAGGYDAGNPSNKVYRAPINSNGTLGAWSIEPAMIITRAYTSLSVANGFLYCVGGYDVAGNFTSTIESALINPDGSVGTWSITATLPTGTYTGHSHAENGFLYATIAYHGNITRQVLRAAIRSNGGLGAFTETGLLPQPLYVGTMIPRLGHLYHVGGYNAGAKADVYHCALAAPSHRALYSREFTFNNDKELLSITVTGGALPKGAVRLLVYGSTNSANSWGLFPILFDNNVNLGTPDSLGNTLARYALVVLDLDDTFASAMNQDFLVERDVTSITLTYNTRPTAPTGLDQRELAGSLSIPPGGGANDGPLVATGVTFRATTFDEDGDQVILRIEYMPLFVSFSGGAGTPSGSSPLGGAGLTDVLLSTGLTPGTRYHWRAWVNDSLGAQSPFVVYGLPLFENTTTDFYMDQAPNNPNPNAGGSAAGQFEADGLTVILENADANSGTIVFKSTILDPDGTLNTVTFEIEAIQTITAFSGTSTATSGTFSGAGPFNAQVTQVFSGGALGQTHHWRARVKDNEGVVSAWVSFGVAPDGNKDFTPVNASPPTLGALVQRNLPAGTGNVIAVGGETELLSSSVSIEVPITDPDPGLGGEVILQLEIRPVGTAFTSPSVSGFAAAMGAEPTVFFETSYVPNPVTGMITVAGLADGSYHWQVRAVDNTPAFKLATLWTGFGGNNENPPTNPADTDFYVDQVNDNPAVPVLNQYQSDATVVLAVGASAPGMKVKGTILDPNVVNADATPSSQVKIQIEIQPVGTPFVSTNGDNDAAFAALMGGAPTVFFESTAALGNGVVEITLPAAAFANGPGTGYHWQYRSMDTGGAFSVWSSFGGNADPGDVDFTIVPNVLAGDPTALSQVETSSAVSIPAGFAIATADVTINATLADSLLQQCRLQLEFRPVTQAFTSPATFVPDGINFFQTAFLPSGSTHSVNFVALADGGYHWQVRSMNFGTDGTNGIASNYVEFGGNPSSATDFRIETANDTPSVATGLSQFAPPDGHPVMVGGVVIGRTIILQAEGRDPESDLLTLQFELQPVGTAFTNVPTHSVANVSPGVATRVVVNDLATGGYHWQARTTDRFGLSSAWIEFGGNGASDDFIIDATVAISPNAPFNLQQWLPNNASVIPTGATIAVSALRLKATLTHPRGEAVKMEVEVKPVGTPFANVATKESAFVSTGTVADILVFGFPNNFYRWQARTLDTRGGSSAWVSYGANPETTPPDDPLTGIDESDPSVSPVANDFVVDTGTGISPDLPVIIGQYRDNGLSPIPVGGTITAGTVVFRAFLTDPNGDAVRLEVEVKPLGVAFDGRPSIVSAFFTNGVEILVTISGLADGPYKWRARATDSTGASSSFVDFGANLDTDDDFNVNPVLNTVPSDPSALDQLKLDGVTPVPVAGPTSITGIVFSGSQADVDGDQVRLEIEVRPVGGAFANSPTAIGDFSVAGFSGQVSMTGFRDGESFHWQMRVTDSTGGSSNWVAYGGNADPGDVDFFTTTNGIADQGKSSKKCGSFGLDLLLPVLILLGLRRRTS